PAAAHRRPPRSLPARSFPSPPPQPTFMFFFFTPRNKTQNPFFLEAIPAASSREPHPPASPGSYKYMPYRGPGHYKLGQALSSRGPQRCHYFLNGEPRNFTVVSFVSYGLLELSGFS